MAREHSKKHITDTIVKDLVPPAKGNKITYDDAVLGFGIRITAGGVKSFVLNYHFNKNEHRMTIGQYPAWKTTQAREAAKIYRQQIDLGIDPLKERTDERSAPTMQSLYEHYRDTHLPKLAKAAQADQKSVFEKRILPELGKHTKLRDITSTDIDELHAKITAAGTPIRANRILEMLRKAMNLAIRKEWLDRNPCVGTHRNREEARTNYLEENMLHKVLLALDVHSQKTSANAIRFLIFTGARKGETFKAKWSEFDLVNGTWTKPSAHTKQRKEHKVRLAAVAIELLHEIKKDGHPTYVFAGAKGKPITDVKKTWASICKSAGVENVRINDQRRTFASLLIADGAGISDVMKFLGHTQVATSARYIALLDKKQHNTISTFNETIQGIMGKNDGKRTNKKAAKSKK